MKTTITIVALLLLTACGSKLSQADYAAFKEAHHCKRTGEFVGRDAEPVYICDGEKYKQREILHDFYLEENK